MSRANRQLSIAECRRLLPATTSMSDRDVEYLRNQLYAVARLIRAVYTQMPVTPGEMEEVPEEDRPEVEERAAILEFDGKLNREESERLALTLYLQSKSRH